MKANRASIQTTTDVRFAQIAQEISMKRQKITETGPTTIAALMAKSRGSPRESVRLVRSGVG